MKETIYIKKNGDVKETPIEKGNKPVFTNSKPVMVVEKKVEKPEPVKVEKTEPAQVVTPEPSVEEVKVEAKTVIQPTPTAEPGALSEIVLDYVNTYKQIIEYEKQPISQPIHVDELASRVAKVYEKVRRVIDWKEEHVIRRTAIERVLKRRLLSETNALTQGVGSEDLAEPIILELMRSGYFKNDSISEKKIPQVAKVLRKYMYIIKNSAPAKKDIKTKMHFYSWLIEVASCELEDILDPLLKEFALLNLMTDSIYTNLEILPEGNVSAQDRFIQTYIASHRTLYNLDDSVITYHLLQYRYHDWNNLSDEQVREVTDNIQEIWDSLDEQLNDKLGPEFFKVCDKYDAVYLILGDVMKKIEEEEGDFIGHLSTPETLDKHIDDVYLVRYSTLKGRLTRSAAYSTLSIFLAGGVTMFIVEVPLAKLVHGKFSPLAMLVDTLLPSLLMFFLVAIIRLPPKDNLQKLKDEMLKLVTSEREMDSYLIRINKKKKVILNSVFLALYIVTGIASLAFVFWVFKLVRVPWTSLYVDTVNVAVVVFTAMIIKQRAQEITIGKDGTVANFIMNLFTIPLAKMGKWFANVWKEYNFVSAFFTALVDTPISMFIEMIEDWRNFIDDQSSDLH